jgi:mannosyltransferase OCH1-like enzyme
MIPRVFHRIWVGPDPPPEAYAAYGETWRRHHPSWEMWQWTEENLPDGMRPEAYEVLRHPTERSDLLRYELLHRFGGVYLDMDVECLRPIDDLVEGLDFLVGYLTSADEVKRPPRVGTAILGGVAGHPALARAIRQAEPRKFFGYGKDATGPIFFDALLRDFPSISPLPRDCLYPQTPEQRAGAFAVHQETRSWLTHAQMGERIKRLNHKSQRLTTRAQELDAARRALKEKNQRLQRKLDESERRGKRHKELARRNGNPPQRRLRTFLTRLWPVRQDG